MDFDFSGLEAEFAKLKTYVAEGVNLVNEVPAALNVALQDVTAVEGAIGSLKTSVTAAAQAVKAAIPVK